MRQLSSAILAAFILFSCAATRATAAIYTFETDPLAASTPFSSTASGITATFAGSTFADPGAFEISYNSTSGPLPLYAGLSGAFLTTALDSLDPSSPLTITFSQPVSALSLSFALGAGSGSLSFATNAGGSATALGAVPSGHFYAEGKLAYAGPAFTIATLSTAAPGFAVDDIAVTAVPEPASLAALGAGVAGLLLRRRRGA